MTVWQDVHEKGGMKSLVKSQCEDVTVTDDFGGDYAVGGYLIERKGWEEVVGRMTEQDRNLYYQLDKLTTAADELGLKPALLLEGNIGGTMSHTRMDPESVAKYLGYLPQMGVTVIPSTGRSCSAYLISLLESGKEPDVRRVRGTPDREDHRERFVIEGFPGVGPGTAESLLEHFGSIKAVVTATEDELCEVDGVGPATASKIVDTAE